MKLSITENGKEGKSKVITSCRYLEAKVRECSQKRRSTNVRKCGNAWSGLENTNQAAAIERED